MAIMLSKIEQYLDFLELKYQKKDENTLLTGAKDDSGQVMIVIRLMEDGEFLQMRTVQHLDDLIKEVDEDSRIALLKWMLYANYQTKLGTWEYDSSDHDLHLSVSFPIEDGDLTAKQFARLLHTLTSSCKSIPEMKAVMGVAAEIDPVELKRKELLAQLAELDGNTGI